MKVLNAMVRVFKKHEVLNLDNILFVCTQHLLSSTIALFKALLKLGANPNNIILIGKQYSACPLEINKLIKLGIQVQELTPLYDLGKFKITFDKDLNKMWQTVKNRLKSDKFDMMIVLDDGGRSLEFLYNDISINIPIIGIEQTTAGLFNPNVLSLPIPFIDVASSAAKLFIEPRIISYEILTKLQSHLPQSTKNIVCGVVGLGTIGKAVTKKLLELKYDTIFYERQGFELDASITKAVPTNSIEELIAKSDYIFGCTGRDITSLLNIEKTIKSNKTFISCSSEDKEFLTMLKHIKKTHPKTRKLPLKNLSFPLKNERIITILNGGFPINFDRIHEVSPPYMIQITRGLLLGAIIQAVSMVNERSYLNNNSSRVALDYSLQKFIVNVFKQNSRGLWPDDLLKKFNDINWIGNNSSGIQIESTYFNRCFDQHPKIDDIKIDIRSDFDITEFAIA